MTPEKLQDFLDKDHADSAWSVAGDAQSPAYDWLPNRAIGQISRSWSFVPMTSGAIPVGIGNENDQVS